MSADTPSQQGYKHTVTSPTDPSGPASPPGGSPAEPPGAGGLSDDDDGDGLGTGLGAAVVRWYYALTRAGAAWIVDVTVFLLMQTLVLVFVVGPWYAAMHIDPGGGFVRIFLTINTYFFLLLQSFCCMIQYTSTTPATWSACSFTRRGFCGASWSAT